MFVMKRHLDPFLPFVLKDYNRGTVYIAKSGEEIASD